MTIIGLHIGGGSDDHVANSTAFYLFDAGNTGIYAIDTSFSSLSNGGLYMTSAVPEPATYGMLLAGLGLMGAALRRRQS
ncbi:PEPxxWA-CTERM sorting domain-containing protein [Duganella radicis]|uniref:PEPxxWA-CTERM sorting domain-containing protein n=2 Tax=Duganella radicis TaxID=551988 RepID=A0A6L6PGA8_9BURK|nr:PEPxxWA-CTERM sorting domain-containing protein [Duganella radicis]